jgi:hypothetical protein
MVVMVVADFLNFKGGKSVFFECKKVYGRHGRHGRRNF